MQILKDYVKQNSTLLFKHIESEPLTAIFDNRGFWFTDDTQIIYNQIKHQPHIYVAWSNDGFYYVGKSFQQGGRWKRSHAYHLGTLAYHLLDTINQYDQNHAQWINNWMQLETLNIEHNTFKIKIKKEVFISFIPFNVYSNLNPTNIEKAQIRAINTMIEAQLIMTYLDDKIPLLNVQNNRKL